LNIENCQIQIIKMKEMSEIEMDRIIEMAWEDRTPFEAIEIQFKCSRQRMISNNRISKR